MYKKNGQSDISLGCSAAFKDNELNGNYPNVTSTDVSIYHNKKDVNKEN
jgi:hypothetical protein